ncbi:bifunctional oligoribonuclease/PAP phosphatase NrnA [bacterium]|nr:bifunctional oligoribonuclease/PAP phosphatase NrnA [bacterium]MBU1990498.1 bifunctional oligoribonuclease/PAP phosphatase NrnA [bacterium]
MSEILKRIDDAGHVVVIAHAHPDADSIGAASAFYTHLLRLHKKVSFFCVTHDINPKLKFIPWTDKIRNSFVSSADLAISFDCASRERLGVEVECDLINIDHHEINTNFGNYSLVDKSRISTTEVLFYFFKENGIEINAKMATALYAGLLDDSGGFLDEKVNGMTFALAGELIERGADYKLCNKFIMKYTTLGAFRLKAIMHKNMKLYLDAKVAVFCVSDDDMKTSGAIEEDCENSLEEALHLQSVEVALLLKQNSDFSIKGSLRSKTADLLKIASCFGGGGHKNRAGFTIGSSMSLENARDDILKLIYKEI